MPSRTISRAPCKSLTPTLPSRLLGKTTDDEHEAARAERGGFVDGAAIVVRARRGDPRGSAAGNMPARQ